MFTAKKKGESPHQCQITLEFHGFLSAICMSCDFPMIFRGLSIILRMYDVTGSIAVVVVVVVATGTKRFQIMSTLRNFATSVGLTRWGR